MKCERLYLLVNGRISECSLADATEKTAVWVKTDAHLLPFVQTA